jgi:hypothetical protein
MGAVTVWNPLYHLEGNQGDHPGIGGHFRDADSLMPALIALPARRRWRANCRCHEVAERRTAEEKVRRIEELEERVATHRRAGRLEDQLLHSQK